MAKKVNTVTGPVSADKLGVTLAHEHLLFGYPGYQGDLTLGGFDHDAALQANVDVIKQLKSDHGLNTIIDATPNECGRNVVFMKEVAEKTNINVICATGYYFEGEGAPAYFHWRLTMGDIIPEIYNMMTAEITQGIMGTDIKAGIIKLATSKGKITDYEKAFFTAGARVAAETGTVVVTHTQEGTMGPEQADLLISQGVNPKKIQIGHMEGNLDLDYQKKVLDKGVYISFDRIGLQVFGGSPMDPQRVETVLALIKAGYGDQILLSHDFIQCWLGRPGPELPPEVMALIENWNWSNVFTKFVPSLKTGGATDADINKLLVENPQRLYGL
jgi:phosphotriesterase-related protein